MDTMRYKMMEIILVACICVSTNALKPDPEVLIGNIPGYAITTGIQQLNSTRCRKEMEEYRDAVDRRVLWGLRMLDTSGQPSSGFVVGNNFWIGSRQQCTFLNQRRNLSISDKHIKNNSIYRNPAEEFPPFKLNFFSAHVRHNSTVQYHAEIYTEDIIVVGLCLPASCDENEVGIMLTKMFDDRLLLTGQLYSTDFKLIRISSLKDDHTWLHSGKIITILFIFAIILGTVIVGTVYDVFLYQNRLKKNKLIFKENLENVELKVEENEKSVQEYCVVSSSKPFGQFLINFSAYSNIKCIFSTNNNSEDLPVLHGLKFFGMIWIIIAHSLMFIINVLNQKAEIFTMVMDIEMQIAKNASYSVDTFFFMSGFLLSFSHLKSRTKAKNVLSLYQSMMKFSTSLVYRYMRLTPTYLVTIMFAIVYFSWHEKISPYYFDEPVHELCSKYWWRNILYINNLFHWNQMCMTPSWYIANDMQFYIFGLFLLTLSTCYHYTAISLSILTLFLSTALHAYIAYALRYVPTLDIQYETLTYVYIRPWTRIPPYIVGMGTAVFLKKLNYKLHLSKKVLTVCWSLCILCNGFIIVGVPHKNISLSVSVPYEAFSRFAWSLGIAWIMIACVTNNSGVVNKFLSLPYWIPFSKLTYCVYLLNEVVILGVSMHSNYVLNSDKLTIFTMSLGFCVMIYSCALILAVTVELPSQYFRSILIPNKSIK